MNKTKKVRDLKLYRQMETSLCGDPEAPSPYVSSALLDVYIKLLEQSLKN